MVDRLVQNGLTKVLAAAVLSVGAWFIATGSSKGDAASDVPQSRSVSVAPTQSLQSLYPGPLIIHVPQASESHAPPPAAEVPEAPPAPRGTLTPIYPTPHFRYKGQ